MPKKYAGYTGNPSATNPTNGGPAPGAWQAPTEVARQVGLSAWPLPSIDFVASSVGDYLYASSSGVAFSAVDTGDFLIPSGQAVSRTTYSGLFDTIGILYGSGDNSTTFNLPNLTRPYIYLKCQTAQSELTFASASGVGRLPNHTHTFNQATNYYNSNAANAPGPVGRQNTSYSATLTSRLRGTFEGNRGATMEMVPLISVSGARAPVGVVAQLLIPDLSSVSNFVPPTCVISSGQTLDRTTYSNLYEKIGNLFGSGDGSTTFTCPDLRGLFLGSPFYNIQIPSGHHLPSGFIGPNVAAHTHNFTAWFMADPIYPAGGGMFESGLYPPDSSSSSVGANQESRPNNITCVHVLVVK